MTSCNCKWWQSNSHPLYSEFCWLLATCPHVLPAVCSHFIAFVSVCENKYTDLYMTWVTGITCEELNVPLTLCRDWMPISFWCCILRGDCESVILVIWSVCYTYELKSEAFWNMTPCGLVSSFIFRVCFVNSCRLWKWSRCLLKVCHCP